MRWMGGKSSGLKEDVNSRAFEGLFWTVGKRSLALLNRALERMHEQKWSGVEWNGADRQERQMRRSIMRPKF